MHLTATLLMKLPSWKKYLDLGVPDQALRLGHRISPHRRQLSEPGRMKALQAMCKSKPSDGRRAAGTRSAALSW